MRHVRGRLVDSMLDCPGHHLKNTATNTEFIRRAPRLRACNSLQASLLAAGAEGLERGHLVVGSIRGARLDVFQRLAITPLA